MRLLMAASAVFVLLAGLTALIVATLVKGVAATTAIIIFVPFLVTGLLLLAAGAFISADVVKLFLESISSLGGGQRG